MKKIVLKTFVDSRLPRSKKKAWEKGLVFETAKDNKTQQVIRELEGLGFIADAPESKTKRSR